MTDASARPPLPASPSSSTASVSQPDAEVVKPSKLQRDRASAVKEYIEGKYSGLISTRAAQNQEWSQLEEDMQREGLSEAEKDARRNQMRAMQRSRARLSRKRITIDDFILLKIIGKGAFGQVRLVKRKDTGEVLAMKTMVKAKMVLKNQVTHVRAERNILALNSESSGKQSAAADPLGTWLVQLNTSFQDSHNLYLVMEFLSGGDLMGMLIEKDQFSEDATRFYAAEAVLAIEAVHALGYIHRDIKPDNFLLDHRGHIKLTDLGLCKKVDQELLPGMDNGKLGAAASGAAKTAGGPGGEDAAGGDRPRTGARQHKPGSRHNRKLAASTVGTPNYISPEVLVQEGYGMDCDWWSLGVILFECLYAFPPFDADDEDQMRVCRNIINWRKTLVFPKEASEKLSSDCIAFLKGLICAAADRLGSEEGAIELKRHAWFKKTDFERIREQDAPFMPPFSKDFESIAEQLKRLDAKAPEFPRLLDQITVKFDQYADEPLPGQLEGAIGGPQRSRPDPKWCVVGLCARG